MTTAFFIADIHLGINSPQRTRLLLSFCDYVLSNHGDLYILGDLFDFWANNKVLRQAHQPLFKKFEAFSAQGQTVGVLLGNRDFLLSQKALNTCGARFLGEEAEIVLDGLRFFLAHGHTLCLADTQFLAYKKKMWPLFRLLDLVLPGWIENRIARSFIRQSKKVISRQNPERFAFTRSAIEKLFTAGIDIVICGHTHTLEHFSCNGKQFFALPAWDDNAGHYLRYHNGSLSLHTLTNRNTEGLVSSQETGVRRQKKK